MQGLTSPILSLKKIKKAFIMTVSAISSAMSVYTYLQNSTNKTLSEDLIEKLSSLGIDPSSVSSTAEALQAISEAEESSETDTESEGDEEEGETSDESPVLRERAERLADKVGIEVSENDTIDDILDNVQDVIDKMLSYAVDKNDRAMYDKFKSYQTDLDNIQSEMNGGGFSGTAVFSFMDMVAEQNKYALNLNKKDE